MNAHVSESSILQVMLYGCTLHVGHSGRTQNQSLRCALCRGWIVKEQLQDQALCGHTNRTNSNPPLVYSATKRRCNSQHNNKLQHKLCSQNLPAANLHGFFSCPPLISPCRCKIGRRSRTFLLPVSTNSCSPVRRLNGPISRSSRVWDNSKLLSPVKIPRGRRSPTLDPCRSSLHNPVNLAHGVCWTMSASEPWRPSDVSLTNDDSGAMSSQPSSSCSW
jgi:hypothetical protein